MQNYILVHFNLHLQAVNISPNFNNHARLDVASACTNASICHNTRLLSHSRSPVLTAGYSTCSSQSSWMINSKNKKSVA
jgi:hypothetical protein